MPLHKCTKVVREAMVREWSLLLHSKYQRNALHLHKGASIYNVRSGRGRGSPKSRQREQNQLICDSDRGVKNSKFYRRHVWKPHKQSSFGDVEKLGHLALCNHSCALPRARIKVPLIELLWCRIPPNLILLTIVVCYEYRESNWVCNTGNNSTSCLRYVICHTKNGKKSIKHCMKYFNF